jgi:uncharacterized protein YndB with AHSA1/START domain
MPGYRFLTTWCLEAPINPVWDAIYDSERWPEWWRGVERVVELAPGDEEDIGQRAAYTWRSRLPYELTFEVELTRKEAPHLLAGEASGELTGTGTWRISEGGGLTTVLYEWDVRTTRPWMNRLAPIARPVFAWNHDWVMKRGGEGLARLLDARLVVASGGGA